MNPVARRLLTNWLLFVAAIIAAILLLTTRQAPTTAELHERERSLLKVFNEDQVSRIEVEALGDRFVLARGAASEPQQPDTEGDGDQGYSEFSLVTPIEEHAKSDKVRGLLDTLKFATFVRDVTDGLVDHKAIGLEQPRFVLHVDQGLIHYRLRLGGAAPAPAGCSYLEVTGENAPGKGVFVVRQGLIDQLSVTLADFRSHELAAIGKGSLAAVRFSDGQSQWALQDDDGRWRFAAMLENLLADRDGVDQFFMQLSRLKFEEFLPTAEAQTLLSGAVTRLTLTPKKATSTPIEITLGAACPGHPDWAVAVRSGPESVAGCVSQSLSQALKVSADTLLDRHAFALHADEVESVELKRGEAILALSRSASGYRMTSPEQGEAVRDLAEERLRTWLDLSGVLLPADSATKFEIAATLTLHGVSDIPERHRDERVDFGPLEAGKPLFARRQADGALLQLAAFDPSQFDVNGLLLRGAFVLDLQTQQLQRVEVIAPGVHQVIEQDDTGTHLVLPSGFQADGVLVSGLLDAVRGLRAVRWVAPSDNGTFGLVEPRAQVKLTVKSGNAEVQARTLRVGASTQGGFFAELDSDAVFVLGRHVVETLAAWVLDRAVFSARLESVGSIELRSADGSLKLIRAGARFNQTDGASRLSRAQIDDLVNELAALRPEGAVHLGNALPNEGLSRPTLTFVAGAGGSDGVEWTIGAADVWHDLPIYYGRVKGLEATYALPRGPIQRILDAL